jgi:Tol biopolymer transport system component
MTMTQPAIARLTAALAMALTLACGSLDHGLARGATAAPARLVGSPSAAPHIRLMHNGKIAFVSYNGAPTINVINPDGSGFRRVLPRCFRPGKGCEITGLSWSPGGRKLAFLRGFNTARSGSEPGPAYYLTDVSLNVMNADGSGAKQLARCESDCFDTSPSRLSWSPDGSRILFSRRGSLYSVNVSSGRLVRLTTCSAPSLSEAGKNGCYDWSPAWSPDGSRIVFSRNTSRLVIIRATGSGMQQIVNLPGQYPAHASWSPDGSRIVFDAGDAIDEVRANGSHRSLLFSGSRGSGPDMPSWSPDGAHILFYDHPIVRPNATRSSGRIAVVWMMNADGTHQQRLFHSTCCAPGGGTATWSPDSTRIAFSLGGIYLIYADGRHLHRLTSTFDVGPVWRPVP